uniref:Kringle domain-containing protein n=1 Tax=Amphilophus citrinellus TaxID=61819 RepID=A0A3Q0QY37_AMPCI
LVFSATEPPAIIPEVNCVTCQGVAYQGTIAVTKTGKTCQSWSAQMPHTHNQTPENNHCKGLDNNYCRNPDNEKIPWCYTTDPDTRWEYCNVMQCSDTPASGIILANLSLLCVSYKKCPQSFLLSLSLAADDPVIPQMRTSAMRGTVPVIGA